MAYKPEQAVILFVQAPADDPNPDTGYICHLLAGTYQKIPARSTAEFIQGELTKRQIPWDVFGRAAGDMHGFGREI